MAQRACVLGCLQRRTEPPQATGLLQSNPEGLTCPPVGPPLFPENPAPGEEAFPAGWGLQVTWISAAGELPQ